MTRVALFADVRAAVGGKTCGGLRLVFSGRGDAHCFGTAGLNPAFCLAWRVEAMFYEGDSIADTVLSWEACEVTVHPFDSLVCFLEPRCRPQDALPAEGF